MKQPQVTETVKRKYTRKPKDADTVGEAGKTSKAYQPKPKPYKYKHDQPQSKNF